MKTLELTNEQLALIKNCLEYSLMMAEDSDITWSATDPDCSVEDHIDALENLINTISNAN